MEEVFNSQLSTVDCELKIDLQLFAAEDEGRTEDPTSRKISKARQKGQVAKSAEISQISTTLVCLFLLSLLGSYYLTELYRFIYTTISNIHAIDFTPGNISMIMVNTILLFLKITLPIMVTAVVVAIVTNMIQVGFMFTMEPLKPDLSKLKPSMSKIFNRLLISKKTLFEFAKSIAKLAIIVYIAYRFIKARYLDLLLLIEMHPLSSFFLVAKIAYQLAMVILLLLIIIAICDYFYQKREWKESLKMTKQEVKDEYKMLEGDPLIKSRIRERQREAARRRMMQEIPKADVVITNPTHIAVAIRYVAEYMAAPVVVAKGEGFVARRIVEIAEKAGIPVVENKPLAEALYRSTEVGEEIPEELYRAVAEVLSYVYRMRERAV
ncbi:MAG: flagellar biosynthesis protein FlhB [bacterium]|nr:flagellar biosynthesis protein FlhB [bacterium]